MRVDAQAIISAPAAIAAPRSMFADAPEVIDARAERAGDQPERHVRHETTRVVRGVRADIHAAFTRAPEPA